MTSRTRHQLRVYRIKDGELDDWIAEWREHVLPLRRAQGFEVLGPWVAGAENRFVWIVGHEDFEAANEAYMRPRSAVHSTPIPPATLPRRKPG